MKTYVQPGDTITITAGATIASGDGVLTDGLFGIATDSVVSGDLLTLVTAGVVTVAKTTGTAWTVGQPIYWDVSAAKAVTTSTAGDPEIGVCVVAAASGATTGAVLLGASAKAARSSGTVAVAGGTLAIPVTHRYVAKTTGGVEALTLADGIPGQDLTISLVTDGGDGTLTPTTASGWASVTLADAGDTVSLHYVDDTVGWIITGAHGATAQPAVALS